MQQYSTVHEQPYLSVTLNYIELLSSLLFDMAVGHEILTVLDGVRIVRILFYFILNNTLCREIIIRWKVFAIATINQIRQAAEEVREILIKHNTGISAQLYEKLNSYGKVEKKIIILNPIWSNGDNSWEKCKTTWPNRRMWRFDAVQHYLVWKSLLSIIKCKKAVSNWVWCLKSHTENVDFEQLRTWNSNTYSQTKALFLMRLHYLHCPSNR